ncbi:MAG: ferritin-like domain-containing protein [Candidatus Rokubacteria bacterium]|nr:ferritin-like domain-containing protein [Candidatus Rokubacteria bacterium]
MRASPRVPPRNPDVERFVKELAAENRAFWVDRDVRLDPGAAPELLLDQIRYRMRQGVYNELRSAELIAAWIPYVKEREIRDLLPRQLDDEQRHYQLLRKRLLELGEDPDGYAPLTEWVDLFDWLVACRSRPTLEKLAMFQFAGETQSCEGFETLIRLAEGPDPETANLYRTQILPDEYRHAAIGRQALLLLADTPDAQRQAREACREMNARVFAAYRSHRARTDRGG